MVLERSDYRGFNQCICQVIRSLGELCKLYLVRKRIFHTVLKASVNI